MSIKKMYILVLLFIISFSALIVFSVKMQKEDKLKIAITTWIGYTPLIYADEKGWLSDIDVKIVYMSSLSENVFLYKSRGADAFGGTQYEYKLLNKKFDLCPVLLLNKSFGGDKILSNRTLEELKKSQKKIDIFLEIDSVNSLLLEAFLQKYKISQKNVNIININQTSIIDLNIKRDEPTIIITYSPYDTLVNKTLYSEVASTKNGLSISVIDGIFAEEDTILDRKEQFEKLKKIIDMAIYEAENNPKEFYSVIKYRTDISYEEFMQSKESIKWLNELKKEDTLKELVNVNIPPRICL